MTEFAKSTKPPEASQKYRAIGYTLGLLVTVMAVAQMISFEEFVVALRDYNLTGERGTVALAIMLISLEVFSVPFLFRLTLSPFARLFSALFVVLLPCVWVTLILAGLAGSAHVLNSGYFGGFSAMQLDVVLAITVAWLVIVGSTFGKMGGFKALKPKKF